LLPGGAIQFPGGSFIPLCTSAFHGALLTPDYNNYRSHCSRDAKEKPPRNRTAYL
jgi:hypothetical protein